VYTLHLTAEDIDTIAFVGHRYAWADALRTLAKGVNELQEHEAWAIHEAIDADMEGGHDAFPMLDTRGELADKLLELYMAII
jgi:hypothetical protein